MAKHSTWAIQIFYDGECPICRREIAMIRRLDRHGRVVLTNLAAAGFDPAYYKTDWETLMQSLHGRLPDGSWVEGVEVMRQVYAALGFRWLVAPTRLFGIRQTLSIGYRIFAKNRLWLTGRCDTSCKTSSNRVMSSQAEDSCSQGTGI